jgi:hypothetical protein
MSFKLKELRIGNLIKGIYHDYDDGIDEEIENEIITPITELENKLNILKLDERYRNSIQLLQDIYYRTIE